MEEVRVTAFKDLQENLLDEDLAAAATVLALAKVTGVVLVVETITVPSILDISSKGNTEARVIDA